ADVPKHAGLRWGDGYAAAHVTGWGRADPVVQGNDVGERNPENEAAKKLQRRIVREAEFWGELTSERFRIVVCGSHDKTTTARLIAWILRSARRNPGFRLGMSSPDLGAAAAWGTGR